MIVYLVGDEFLVVPGDGLKQTGEVLLGPHLVAVNLEERLPQSRQTFRLHSIVLKPHTDGAVPVKELVEGLQDGGQRKGARWLLPGRARNF